MSSDSESPVAAPKTAKPIRRFGTGLLSITQVICMLVIYVAANFLSGQHHVPKDLSSEAAYTLSSSTRRYLESPEIKDRPDTIRMTVAFRRSSPIYEKVRMLAEEYSRLSHGKVEVKMFDPNRQQDQAQQVIDQFGAVYGAANKTKAIFNTDLIIVDARKQEDREKAKSGSGQTSADPHIRFIEGEMMGSYQTDQEGQRRLIGFRGEDSITAALVGAIEGKAREVYLLLDKSGFTVNGDDGVLANFEKILLTQNMIVRGARMSEMDRIPDDAAAVAIINPAYDFSPTEIKALEDYWNRARSGIFITLGASETPPNLRAFLRNQGIMPGNDRVLTTKGQQVITTVRGSFDEGWNFTEDFAGKAVIFEGATCSLTVRDKNNDELASKGIMPMVLARSSPEFWGETRFSAPNPSFLATEDVKGPPPDGKLPLIAGVIRGSAARDDVGEQTSRMTVVANSDFLAPKYLSDVNRNFAASSMNWLMGREELTGEGPLTLGTYKLPLLDSELSFINRVNLAFLPAFALIIGAIVWSSRRA